MNFSLFNRWFWLCCFGCTACLKLSGFFSQGEQEVYLIVTGNALYKQCAQQLFLQCLTFLIVENEELEEIATPLQSSDEDESTLEEPNEDDIIEKAVHKFMLAVIKQAIKKCNAALPHNIGPCIIEEGKNYTFSLEAESIAVQEVEFKAEPLKGYRCIGGNNYVLN